MRKKTVIKLVVAIAIIAAIALPIVQFFTPKYTVIVNERRTFTLETHSSPCDARVWSDTSDGKTEFSTCIEGGIAPKDILNQSKLSDASEKYTVDADIEVREYTQNIEGSITTTRQAASVKKVYSVQKLDQ